MPNKKKYTDLFEYIKNERKIYWALMAQNLRTVWLIPMSVPMKYRRPPSSNAE